MKKSLKIVSAILAVAMCVGAGGCSKKTDYPDYYNPESSSVETSEKYVVNVLSEGGLKLDGVKIAAVKDGQTVKRGISVDGKIEFGISLGAYDLVIDEDSLPAGYYLDGTTYQTSASSREEVTVKIPSKIISQTASSGTTLAVGQIMRDFSFTDCAGQTYKLSSLFDTAGKKAVVLNFWYSACGPCATEFPAMQKAYATRSNNVEILAICSTHQGDTNTTVKSYKTEKNLTFPMGIDSIGITSNFGVTSFPTTVIIDRYGLIAYKETGALTSESGWAALFDGFTSESYTQKLSTDSESDGDSESERVKPTVENPSPATLASAASGTGCSATFRFDSDDEFSWPWVAGDGYIYSSNKGVGNSYATVYADIEMEANKVLSIEYNVSSEEGCDLLYVFVNGTIQNPDGWSATDGWQSADLYVTAERETVELAMLYQKDEADPDDGSEGDDIAMVRNITVRDSSSITEPLDVMRAAANGLEGENPTKYSRYITPVMGADGFYHVNKANGPLLYITITNISQWSDLHTGSTTSLGSSDDTYYCTLYNLTYWNYATTTDDSFSVKIGATDVTDTLTTYWTIQYYMDAPYYLLPVNDLLKTWAEAFVADFEEEQYGKTAYGEEWLEFCYYYDHYGSAHNGDDEDDYCRENTDVTRGLTVYNCYTAYEKTDAALNSSETEGEVAGRNKAVINYPLQKMNGSYYKFTATQAGVYQIRSYTTTDGKELDEKNSTNSSCASSNAAPELIIRGDEASDYEILSSTADTGVLDFDQFTGELYQGFNQYITLEAGQTVYLLPTTTAQTEGYYDFEITYLGASYSTMFVASRAAGIWTYDPDTGEGIYIGIDTAYDQATDTYYVAKEDGTPDLTKPIYIDMIHYSFIYSNINGGNQKPLEYFIDNEYFEQIYGGVTIQSAMETYLAQSTQVDEASEYYGMVKANANIVENLNSFFDAFIYGGRGIGNGWLMFACYMEHFGN